MNVDYGVAVLPMLKKRKLGLKTTPAKVASAPKSESEEVATGSVVKEEEGSQMEEAKN